MLAFGYDCWNFLKVAEPSKVTQLEEEITNWLFDRGFFVRPCEEVKPLSLQIKQEEVQVENEANSGARRRLKK